MGPLEESHMIPGLNIRYMKVSGLWGVINTFRDTGEKNMVLKASMFFSMTLMPLYLVLQGVSVFYLTFDLEMTTLFVLNPITCIQVLLKQTVFWTRLDEQSRLMEVLKTDYLVSTRGPKGRGEAADMLGRVARTSNTMVNLALTANIICVVVWNFLPVVRSRAVTELLGLPPSNEAAPNKVLAGWYPFDYHNSPGYEVVYVFELMACSWAGILFSVHEFLLTQTVVMLYAQISVLAHNLAALGTDLGEDLYAQLLLCVKDHQKLMRAADETKSLYNFIITMQLLTGGLIMLFSAFNFVYGVWDIGFLCKFVVYLAYAMVEIALYCYIGCLLETVSEEVTQAAYNSEWYQTSKQFKSTIQMIMVRNTSPQTLIAGRLYSVNLITLSNLLQLTYSTLAVLSRMSEDT